jgi:hypothetical protein
VSSQYWWNNKFYCLGHHPAVNVIYVNFAITTVDHSSGLTEVLGGRNLPHSLFHHSFNIKHPGSVVRRRKRTTWVPTAWNLPCIEVVYLFFNSLKLLNRSRFGFRFIRVVSDTVKDYVHTDEMVDERICVWSTSEVVTDEGKTRSVMLCASYPRWTALEYKRTSSHGEMRGIAWAKARPLPLFNDATAPSRSWPPLIEVSLSLSLSLSHTHTHSRIFLDR